MHLVLKFRQLNWIHRAAIISTAVIFTLALFVLAIALLAVGSVSYTRFDYALLTWGGGLAASLSAAIWLSLYAINAVMQSATQIWNQSMRPAWRTHRHGMQSGRMQWHHHSLTN